VKASTVEEDFSTFRNNEKDLTDFLTKALTKYSGRGPLWTMVVFKKFWMDITGEDPGNQYQIFYDNIKSNPDYSISELAIAMVKAVNYSVSAKKPLNYTQTILDEHLRKKKTGVKNAPDTS